MEQRKCKNKKCQRPLSDGYKYKDCENCRNEKAKQFKDFCKCVGVVVMIVGTVAIKGKIKPTKNELSKDRFNTNSKAS